MKLRQVGRDGLLSQGGVIDLQWSGSIDRDGGREGKNIPRCRKDHFTLGSSVSKQIELHMKVVGTCASRRRSQAGNIGKRDTNRLFPARPLPQQQAAPYSTERDQGDDFLSSGIHTMAS